MKIKKALKKAAMAPMSIVKATGRGVKTTATCAYGIGATAVIGATDIGASIIKGVAVTPAIVAYSVSGKKSRKKINKIAADALMGSDTTASESLA